LSPPGRAPPGNLGVGAECYPEFGPQKGEGRWTTRGSAAGTTGNDAWVHYSEGRFDDALTNAGKAVESACKVFISRVDPARDVEKKKLSQLAPILTELKIPTPRSRRLSARSE
jgi:hypothetical protein